MTKLKAIKSIEDFKEYNIICTNTDEVQECLNMLNNDDRFEWTCKQDRIVAWHEDRFRFFSYSCVRDYYCKDINFYQFKQAYKRLKKEKDKEQKEQLPDFETDDDGRVIKINNWKSRKYVYYMNTIGCNRFIDYKEICKDKEDFFRLEDLIEIGILFDSEENLKKYLFKLEIETKLKNIAHRLNNGEKIDWINDDPPKYCIGFNHHKLINLLIKDYFFQDHYQGIIYCLSDKFLMEAIKEIGKENLIKYFKGE